jgi:hypothetical protein
VPRSSAYAGLAFVGLFALGAAVYGSGAGSSDAEITAYASHGNRLHQLIGFGLVATAGVLLAVFAAGFASRVAIVGGVLSAALLLVANALWAASAFTVELEHYALSPRTHLLFEDAGFACFVSAAAAAIPLVLAVSVERTTPRWLAAFGVAAAIALALSYFYFPFFGVSRVGRRRRGDGGAFPDCGARPAGLPTHQSVMASPARAAWR